MPLMPIRAVGASGLITDKSPYELPANTWTDALNVRFSDGKITPYSAYKLPKNPKVLPDEPVGLVDGSNAGTFGSLVAITKDGTFTEVGTGSTNPMPADALAPPKPTSDQVSATNLGGVSYITLESDTPFYRKDAATGGYERIPGWDSTHLCKTMRSYKDFLIALNVTKGSTSYPQMVKWSDAAQAGAPPDDWSLTDTASLSGETVLNDAKGILLDGKPLGPSMLLYTNEEVYRMDYMGEPFIFDFEKVFSDFGAIAKNCVVEIDNKHYVFSSNDIIMHDGIQKISLIDGRVRRRLFDYLEFSERHKCHVGHDVARSELVFYYRSRYPQDSLSLHDTIGCNEAAVYNYKFDTWTFVEAAGVSASLPTSVVNTVTWDEMAAWNELNYRWSTFDSNSPTVMVCSSTSITSKGLSRAIYFLDDLDRGYLTNPIQSGIYSSPFVERLYNDLDEIAHGVYGTKLIRSIHPQVITADEMDTLTIKVGSAESTVAPTVWETERVFSPFRDHKHDTRINGRYIAVRLKFLPDTFGEISSYDIDIIPIAMR